MQVGLGTRVGQTDALEIKTVAESTGKQLLLCSSCADTDTHVLDYMLQCRKNLGVGMAVQACREFRRQVSVP